MKGKFELDSSLKYVGHEHGLINLECSRQVMNVMHCQLRNSEELAAHDQNLLAHL